MSILFQPACFSFSGSDHFQHPQDQFYVFLNGVHFIRPKLPLFFPALPPFFFKDSDFSIMYPFISGKSLRSLLSMFLSSGFPMKMLSSFKLIILHRCFFSGGSNSSFQCWSYSFPRVKCFLMRVQLLIIHLSLFICSGVLKISHKTCVSILNTFNIFQGCYLIQAI